MTQQAGSGRSERPELTVAFGGGGPFGIAYGLGVADALRDRGLSWDGVGMLGTSAGSWVASCLATGVEFADLCVVPQLRLPSLKPGLLRGIATEIFGDARSPAVTAAAVRLTTGRRALLSGGTHRLADIIAASSAVPGLFAPARVAGGFYVDGGVRSLVSADHAVAARNLLVVAPIAGPMFGPGGRAMEHKLRNEMTRWQVATCGNVHLLRPNADIASLARHPLQLFDKGRAVTAYEMAHAQATRLLDERASLARLLSDLGVAA